VTPNLESALSGLPAKPRVHELSKRIGISNKELLAALAERGLTITSSSSSVPLAVAQEVIQSLLGGDGTSEPIDQPDTQAATPVEAPPDVPATPPDAINPLFLPPVADAGSVVPDEEPAGPARSGSSRRRRGRSGASRRPADQESTEAPGDVAPDDAVVPEATATAEPPADTADETNDERPSGDTDSDADDDAGSRNRRRRRGRRGRGRVAETDEQDSESSEQASAEQDGAGTSGDAEAGSQAPAVQDEDATTETESDADADAESEGGQRTGSGNRRRRRRRRGSGGDEAPREDDPDNTVVHVREPRLSQAGSSSGSAGGSSNEVQGIRGSTRLEAKRQRRRDSRDTSRRRPQILTEAEFLARRESVERVMAVRQRGDLAQVALLEDGILVEHFVSQTGSDSMIGSVFLGRVQNVLPSMEAAFVDIGRGRNAVIYAGEVNWDAAGLNGKARRIETALSSGDTILAQVSKDPVGHKGARLTTQISLPGRFLVYVPGGGATGISRKLPDTERKRLKSILDRIVPEDAGVIIRTAAEGIAEDELIRDVERLKSQWEEISRRAEAKTGAPTQLYAEPGTLIKVVRDLFNSDITRLVVDGDEAYGPVADYVTAVAPELADRLVRYEPAPNGADVFAAYRIDEQIAKALERKVHLPSGGSLVIDRTEAMTVVDVNTGKYTGSGGNLEETVTKNNLEAAEEMVRQLRLRDIGGIIVIDFIDMVLESNRELVLRRLTEALGRDRTRHQVAEVTSLGLVQMTRKRMGTGLVEAFSEPCPHCGGRGIVLHDLPVVASVSDDGGGNERRSGKGRRGRGRDTERVEEIVIPRVVEVPAGRRPDPRGPKPPSIGGGRDSHRDQDQRTEAAADERVATGPDAEEIDWIEAAAAAGIQAAQDADADDFEAHEPGDGIADDDNPVDAAEVAEIVVDDPAEPDSADSVESEVTAAEPAVDVVVEAAETEPAPKRRRGRRAAGRPAGAPPSAQPVDIIVHESVPERAAPVEQQASDGATNGHADNDHADNGHADNGSADNGRADDAVAAPPATPPRRRRAASRPAGPAAGGAGEPVVIAIPVDQPAG